MNSKTGLTLIVMLLTAVMASAFASAATVPLEVMYVEIDGDTYYTDNVAIADKYDRGEEIEITVKVNATAPVENAQIEAYISGYRYATYERHLVSDVTRSFDLEANTADKFDLKLQVPMDMDKKDTKIRIRVSNEDDTSFEQVYQLRIRGVDADEAVQIKEFTVMPSNIVEAGRPLSFKVKVENYGDDDLDDVYVKVSIPDLGIADDETLDEIVADETETFEELLLRIPKCAEPGTYTAEATLKFDKYRESTETLSITVLEGGVCEVDVPTTEEPTGKTVVTVPESQEVVMGTTGGVYPVMVSNLGSTAKTYTLTASGVDAWGTVRFDPAAVVVVQPESVKTVYMYVAADEEAQPGAQVFKLSVESEEDTKQVVLTANINEGGDVQSYDSLRRGLEIGLIVLVIILIILGLIIGFNKLRGDREDDEEAQTYY
ncbi:hypothetical protein GF367_02485 [Candidatus Woesearchaeota archaeon]|nr:hypothetical protein [Candidatus Woesearchaeota archaeon]